MTHFRLRPISRKITDRFHRCRCEPLEHRVLLNATADAQPAFSSATAALFAGDVSAANPTVSPLAGVSYPGGVTVTATQILTEMETIPRFAAQPTISNTRDGNWSDPSIWSVGRVPTDLDRVAITADTVVTYATLSSARLDALEISGSLIFSTSTSTSLTVANLTVMPTGTLQIGTPSDPIAPQVKAEIVIADKPLDFAVDPRELGTGLIALGTVTMHGSTINQTWSSLAAEPRRGDNSLLVAGDVSLWRPGDTLVLPDSRQVLTTQEDAFINGQIAPQWEEIVVDRVEGNQVFLKSPLQFDHLGARNASGNLELLPHAANLSRNVIVRSENPTGTRGHTMYTARARVDIEYARFQDLGRTDAFQNLDNTTFDAAGNVTHIGTNQVGRYAVHFHHMMGPENPTNTGYQFKFVGNTVDGSLKWAVTVHDTSYGLLENNVVYRAQGAGFATEAGSEIGNVFRGNITVRIQGTHVDGSAGTLEKDFGRGGSGFWFRRAGNAVIGNVAADSTYAGFVIDSYNNLDSLVLPKFRGADKHEPGQGILTKLNPGGMFVNNEAYGMSAYGLWMAYPSGDNLAGGTSSLTIYNLRLWNIHHGGVVAYHTDRVAFDRLLILADESAQDRNDTGTFAMDFEVYENRNLVVRNSRIEGAYWGIIAPRNDATEAGVERPTIIQNTTLKNYINIRVSPAQGNRPSNGNSLVVRNVKFGLTADLAADPNRAASVPPPANIYMYFSTIQADLTQRSVVRVYDYNQVPGDDFQVFYHEQSPDFVMPQTDPALLSGRGEGLIGSPAFGMTNEMNWLTYGIATAGGLAPSGATASRPGVNGLVAPLQDLSAISPRVVLVTPLDGARIVGNQPVRIRYNVNGVLPVGGDVYFSLDGGTPFSQFIDGSLYKLTPGQHVLRAYIGGPDGQPLPGTGPAATSSISIVVPPPSLDLNGPAAGADYAATFAVGNGPVPIVDSANLTITDPSSTTLVSAFVSIVINPQSGDVLAADTTGTNITAVLNGTALTLSGNDTLAHYRQVMRSLTFNNTLLNPSPTPRTILFSVKDSNNAIAIAAASVVMPPIIDLNGPAAGADYAATFVVGNGPVPVADSANLTITDPSSTTLVKAVASIVDPQSGDVLAANTAGTNITATFDGTALRLTGSDTLAHYQQVMRSLTFDRTAFASSSALRAINVSVTDSTFTSPIATSIVNVRDSRIAGRMLFYENSSRYDLTNATLPGFSDDNAIAADKTAYLPGAGTATFANVSSYSKGINGIMVDITAAHGSISAADFIFRVGNNNSPGTWATAPAPAFVSVRPGAGVSGSDRVEIVWADGAIQGQWLEVITLAGGNTGLAQLSGYAVGYGDVFYFGNAVGNSGLGDTATLATVNLTDEVEARNHPTWALANIPITNIYDYNRDGVVNSTDQLLSRSNPAGVANALRYLNLTVGSPPNAPQQDSGTGGDGDAGVASALAAPSGGGTIAASPSRLTSSLTAGNVDSATAEQALQQIMVEDRLWAGVKDLDDEVELLLADLGLA